MARIGFSANYIDKLKFAWLFSFFIFCSTISFCDIKPERQNLLNQCLELISGHYFLKFIYFFIYIISKVVIIPILIFLLKFPFYYTFIIDSSRKHYISVIMELTLVDKRCMSGIAFSQYPHFIFFIFIFF